MNGTYRTHYNPENPVHVSPEGVTSLVRGDEESLLQELLPLVRRQPVQLDLGRVERIDAAGVAALIALYRAARDAGRSFTVVNPKPHVREILTVVGLDRFLLCDRSEKGSYPQPELAESAA